MVVIKAAWLSKLSVHPLAWAWAVMWGWLLRCQTESPYPHFVSGTLQPVFHMLQCYKSHIIYHGAMLQTIHVRIRWAVCSMKFYTIDHKCSCSKSSPCGTRESGNPSLFVLLAKIWKPLRNNVVNVGDYDKGLFRVNLNYRQLLMRSFAIHMGASMISGQLLILAYA